MRTLHFTIGKEHEGETVETFLRRDQGFSHKRVVKLKHDPLGMLLNGAHTRTVDRLMAGDVLSIRFAEDGETPVPNPALSAPIAYEDEDVVVFDKPPFMPVHPSIRHYDDTLASVFANYCLGQGLALKFRPVNRLDRDTTGLVLVGKNPHSASFLWQGVEKEYRAVVCGELQTDSGTIDAPIGRERESQIERQVRLDGQRAVTHYRVLGRGQGYTLVAVRLETGRTHQIRVHFAYLGHPLAGDTLYGEDQRLIQRHALHCCRLSFSNRVTGKDVQVESGPPEDMRTLMEQARVLPVPSPGWNEKSAVFVHENE